MIEHGHPDATRAPKRVGSKTSTRSTEKVELKSDFSFGGRLSKICCQRSKIFVKNRKFCQKSKILSKIEIFIKNRKFCQKSKILSKIEIVCRRFSPQCKIENIFPRSLFERGELVLTESPISESGNNSTTNQSLTENFRIKN